MPKVWTPEWSNAVFSIEERDRRWKKVRDLMRRDGVDLVVCLPNSHSHDRAAADSRYLTQLGENSDEVTIAFPLEGEVTAWHSRGGVWPSSNWFTDIRAAGRGTGGKTIVGWIKENKQYGNGTIAIAALTSSWLAHVRADEGEVNWQSVEIIKQGFPNAKYVSATDILGEARYQKSEEEIEFVRKGVEVAELTCDTVRRVARAGVAERELFGEMMLTNAKAGGSFPPMFGWISGPFDDIPHRVEQPSFRKLQTGDMMHIEIEGRWGGYVSQIDRSFSIGAAHPEMKDGIKLAWESFNRVLEKLKPGVTVGELIDAGRVDGMSGRGHASLTMHGRGTGDDGPGLFGLPLEDVRKVQIVEDTVFVVKPSAHIDGREGYWGWGDSVAVRATGTHRLGKQPQELYELI